jgi:hypothetical protein
MKGSVIALFELVLVGPEVRVVEERHYQLAPAEGLDAGAVRSYRD